MGNGEWGMGNGEWEWEWEWGRSNKGVLSFVSASAGYANTQSNRSPISADIINVCLRFDVIAVPSSLVTEK